LLYNTGSTAFIKGQTSYFNYKLTFHFGRSSIVIKLQIILLKISEYFFDIFLAWTLNNFCCRVHIELFEKGGKSWLNLIICICSNEQFQSSIWFIFLCEHLVQLREINRIHLMARDEWWYRDNKSICIRIH
jgi:hypothetical protein